MNKIEHTKQISYKGNRYYLVSDTGYCGDEAYKTCVEAERVALDYAAQTGTSYEIVKSIAKIERRNQPELVLTAFFH